MSGPLRLVIFDVDGTLVDSQADILAAMRAAFAEVLNCFNSVNCIRRNNIST